MVKLLDDDDDTDDTMSTSTPTSTSLVLSDQHTNEGEYELVDEATEFEPQYDYVMMHRALSHLPIEEQERMRVGGLPALPIQNLDDDNNAEVVRFKQEMKALWLRRQQELRDAQEPDQVKVLKEHIVIFEKALAAAATAADVDEKELLFALEELEFHASDVDMARDFHTLGGWPLLVSILSSGSASPEAIQSYQFSDEVRAYAAWAIGTAVKNTGEFFPWAVEPVKMQADIPASAHDVLRWTKTTTALSVLLDIFGEWNGQNDVNTVTNSTDYAKNKGGISRKLQQKVLYATGSLLRGNRLAQEHFIALGGPLLIANVLQTCLSDKDWKVSSKVVLLAHDLITESIVENNLGSNDSRNLIAEAFTTKIWCDGAVGLLEASDIRLKEKSLFALETMTPYCIRDEMWQDKARKSMELLRREWKSTNVNEDYDQEWFAELQTLSDVVHAQLF
eukprot:CAMPEP_0196802648 /NCGR_PEP_ID=MMETSP1362-20130617/2217_1 /TAXON_ID=163516 /ORGANISM="Leptocylindrus danicus, Strain CCMP1856" /LENGTH=448 /DNA_ID=CAMNT_0042173993 /DNA_START=217 /DNA_END=1563 /DNA_ORIENTATION=+